MFHDKMKRVEISAMIILLAQTVAAQDIQTGTQKAMGWLQGATGFIVLGIVIIIAVAAILAFFINNRRAALQGAVNALYTEPEVETSKFEQLLAEIQGLSLRTQSGESKGYYRKIEQLARVYIE